MESLLYETLQQWRNQLTNCTKWCKIYKIEYLETPELNKRMDNGKHQKNKECKLRWSCKGTSSMLQLELKQTTKSESPQNVMKYSQQVKMKREQQKPNIK